MTVRDGSSNVVQFLYGDDGLDPTAAALLGGKPEQMLFLARNHQSLTYKHGVTFEGFKEGEKGRTDGLGIVYKSGQEYQQLMTSAKALMALATTGHHDDSAGHGSIPLSSLPLAKDHVVLARRKKRPGK